MRQALKGVSPSAPGVSAWLWWKSRPKAKPFPTEQLPRAADEPRPEQPVPAAREDLEELERELEQARIRIREAEKRAEIAEKRLRARENGPVALNDATFEDLRSLGLSVSQSARLIAQRDQRGGFSSPDELDGLYGMPRDTITELMQHLRA